MFLSETSFVFSLAALAEMATQKNSLKIPLKLVKEEGEFTDASIEKRLSTEEKEGLRVCLAKVREERKAGAKLKVSATIFRIKLQLIAGNEKECKTSFFFLMI